ncbi:sugar ABC transporter substrate-binding protein [Parenemella sanctibonifatiensis]|uniref:Sugar ABC transporter substrate-binding protein n=2 Tax=Parenemella sanctibonifatiensis TaxID=2016505 RepID=A0A255EA65_9ACTN|nr:sugar ABC transporter substrate-binding protein [Parenemella sanctibonifatiensis]
MRGAHHFREEGSEMTGRLSRRTFGLGALGVGASAFGLSACAPGGAAGGGDTEQTEDRNLTYMYFTDGPDQKATEDLIAKFEQEHDATVALEIVPFANLEQSLQARLSGGNPPDVARLASLTAFQSDLLDLNQFQKEALDGAFLPEIELAALPASGERLAVPSDLTMNGPLINLALFEQAGIEVPTAWTWAEMVAAAEEIKGAAGTEYGIAIDVSGHRFSTMLSQYGTNFYNEDGTAVALDEGMAAQMLTDFTKYNNDGLMPKDLVLQAGSRYSAANEVFLAGQTPIYISGNWQVAAFAENADFEWAVVPNPSQARAGGFPGGKFMAAFKASPRQELAAEFIAFMNSAESQTAMAQGANFLPTRVDLVESGVDYTNRAEDMSTFLEDVSATPPDAFGTAYSPAFSQIAKDFVAQAGELLAGNVEPAAAATALTEAAEAALADVS